MKIMILQRGSQAPEVHHLRPLITHSSPSRRALACMFVASEEATPGSVMPKHERISPRSRGSSHCFLCPSVPYRTSTSMLPVPGALPLKASEATQDPP